MKMSSGSILALLTFSALFIGGIILADWFVTNMLGIDLDKVPTGLKALFHFIGLGAVAYIAKKIFVK